MANRQTENNRTDASRPTFDSRDTCLQRMSASYIRIRWERIFLPFRFGPSKDLCSFEFYWIIREVEKAFGNFFSSFEKFRFTLTNPLFIGFDKITEVWKCTRYWIINDSSHEKICKTFQKILFFWVFILKFQIWIIQERVLQYFGLPISNHSDWQMLW